MHNLQILSPVDFDRFSEGFPRLFLLFSFFVLFGGLRLTINILILLWIGGGRLFLCCWWVVGVGLSDLLGFGVLPPVLFVLGEAGDVVFVGEALESLVAVDADEGGRPAAAEAVPFHLLFLEGSVAVRADKGHHCYYKISIIPIPLDSWANHKFHFCLSLPSILQTISLK